MSEKNGERGLFQMHDPHAMGERDELRKALARAMGDRNDYRAALEQIAVSAPDADLRRIARDAIHRGSRPPAHATPFREPRMQQVGATEPLVMRSSLSPPHRWFPWLWMHWDAARVVLAVAIVPRWMRLTMVDALRKTYSGGKYGAAEFTLEDEGLRRR
jgi:hypothetical protein